MSSTTLNTPLAAHIPGVHSPLPTDWEAVRCMFARELHVAVRSATWGRTLAWTAGTGAFFALLPVLYRTAPNHWDDPPGWVWLRIWTICCTLFLLFQSGLWTGKRLAHVFRSPAAEDLRLTTSHPGDLYVGGAAALVVTVLFLAASLLPGLMLACAVGGTNPWSAAGIFLVLQVTALLGHSIATAVMSRGSWNHSLLAWVFGVFLLVVVAGVFGFNSDHRLAIPLVFLLTRNLLFVVIGAAEARRFDWLGGSFVHLLFISCLWWDAYQISRFREPSSESNKKNDLTVEQFWDQFFHGSIIRPFASKLRRYPLLPALMEDHAPQLREVARAASAASTGAFILFFGRFGWMLFTGLAHGAFQAVSRRLLVFTLCTAVAYSGREVAVRVAETVRGEQWREWKVLPLTNAEVARWLAAGWRPFWWGARIAGAVFFTAAAALPHRPPPLTLLWLALMVWSMVPSVTLLCALLAARSTDAGDAAWKAFCLSSLGPWVVGLGLLFGVAFPWVCAVSPVYALLYFLETGTVPIYSWIGLAVYCLTALLAQQIFQHRLHSWCIERR